MEGNISTVLIVDNDSSFRAVLRTLIEQDGGFDFCIEARSGIEAIEKSSRLLPKLAILDFSLPDMDGLQLAQELRKMMPGLPIFMLIADGDLHAEKEALSRGINAVFSKVEDLETLVANARAVCGIELTRRANDSPIAGKPTPNSLRQGEARLRRLAESNVIGVAVGDLNGKIIDANDAFLKLIGYSRQELASGTLRWDSLTPPEHAESDQRAVEQLRSMGIALPWEKEFFHKDGERSVVIIGAATIEGAEGDIECVSFVLDISERKRLERQLHIAKVASEAANQAKSQFLTNISHELRTPLNGILGMTDLALQTQLTSEQLEYLKTVKTSSELLLTLIKDILDFSTIDAGKIELKLVEFNLRDCLESVLRTPAVLAEQKGLKFLYEVAADVPDIVFGDPARLRQILINLVGNAIKFTDKGEVTIKVRTSPEAGFLRFTVSDTGIGIPKDKRESIFAPFTQADNSSTRKFGGAGLGLTISAWLAATLGGSLWVDSQVGHGSHFHFTIQVKTESK